MDYWSLWNHTIHLTIAIILWWNSNIACKIVVDKENLRAMN